jgi:hypothetical protein
MSFVAFRATQAPRVRSVPATTSRCTACLSVTHWRGSDPARARTRRMLLTTNRESSAMFLALPATLPAGLPAESCEARLVFGRGSNPVNTRWSGDHVSSWPTSRSSWASRQSQTQPLSRIGFVDVNVHVDVRMVQVECYLNLQSFEPRPFLGRRLLRRLRRLAAGRDLRESASSQTVRVRYAVIPRGRPPYDVYELADRHASRQPPAASLLFLRRQPPAASRQPSSAAAASLCRPPLHFHGE